MTYDYYAGQAKLLGAAGVVVRNEDNFVLLLKPTYKAVWHVPGGVMDPGESPKSAALREVQEEIGLDISVGRLLSVDYKTATADRPSGVQFLFDGGILTAAQQKAIRPDRSEIDTWRFASSPEAMELVGESGPAARLANTLAALDRSITIYLEDGQPA
jgi:ADP-ribose pyrophosphatase YjhB (NUDIX family)